MLSNFVRCTPSSFILTNAYTSDQDSLALLQPHARSFAVLVDDLDADSCGTASTAKAFDSATTKVSPMFELSEVQILRKARDLCRLDGKTWSIHDFENGVAGVTMFTVVADDSARAEYLDMARAFLEKKQALLEEKLRAHSVRWLAAAHVADAKPTDLLQAPVA